MLFDYRLSQCKQSCTDSRPNGFSSAEAFLLHMEEAVALSTRWAEIAALPGTDAEQEHRDAA